MKKILILCFLGDPTYPSGSISGTGGFNASVKDVLNYLIESNQYECIVITNAMWNSTKTLCEKISEKIMLYRICSNKKYPDEIQDAIMFQSSVEQIVKDFNSILFIHSFYWLSGKIAYELSVKYQLPFIHTTVSLAKEKLRNNFKPLVEHQLEFENIFLPKAKFILAITEEEKEVLIYEYNISIAKIIVEGQTVAEAFHTPIYDNYGIPHTISSDIPRPLPTTLNENSQVDNIWWSSKPFIYVGRITMIKGLDIIIRAWIALEKRFDGHVPPLWIVGNTPYEIDSFRQNLNIEHNVLGKYEAENRIIWWGYLSPPAISTLYLKASVLVTHSAFESGGRMILEALCQGVPVISSNTGFGKDYIVNWLNGFIVDYGDIENLILRMSHFARNPFLSNVLGANAKATFDNLEKMWHHKARIIKLYEALSRGESYTNTSKEYSSITENAFTKGIVETYPYYYSRMTETDIIKILYNYETQIGAPISVRNLTKIDNADIWEYAQKVVIKNIYSKINKRKIWDISQEKNVLSEQQILESLETICMIPSVLTPLRIDKTHCIIVMPYIYILSYPEILQNLNEIAKVLNKISSHKGFGNAISLARYWKNIIKNIELLDNHLINHFYANIPSRIKKNMAQIVEPTTPSLFCLQYAQSIIGHIGIYQEQLTLLPSTRHQIAEKGLDAGILFLDFLFLNSEEKLIRPDKLDFLNTLSSIFVISKKKILEWALCIYIEYIIQGILFEKYSDKYFRIYDSLLDLFNNIL